MISGQIVLNSRSTARNHMHGMDRDKDCGECGLVILSIFAIENCSGKCCCTQYSTVAKPGEAVCVCACTVSECVALCSSGTVCWRCAPDPTRPVLTRLPRRPVLPRDRTGTYGPGHTPSF